MDNDEAIWEKTFVFGIKCGNCSFSEPELEWMEVKKRMHRECVARSAKQCPGVIEWHRAKEHGN